MRKRFFGFVAVFAATLFASAVHPQPALKMMIPANPGGRLGPDRAPTRGGDAKRQTCFLRAIRK